MMENNMKVVSKLLLTIETDIETGDIKLLNREVINDDLQKPADKPKSSSNSKVASKSSDEPKLILEENKYLLSESAVSLMDVAPGDKIDIKYEKINGKTTPIIGKDESFGTKGGNKLSKSNTVSFRGVKHAELSKYGNEFTVTPYDGKNGLFILNSDTPITEEIVEEDPYIGLDEKVDLPFDLSIEDFTEDTEEIDSALFDFKL